MPQDEHEPFVIGYDINVDEEKPELSTFHVSISTVFLLKLGLKSRHLYTDATYVIEYLSKIMV